MVQSVDCHHVAKKQLLGKDIAKKITNPQKVVVSNLVPFTSNRYLKNRQEDLRYRATMIAVLAMTARKTSIL